MKNEGLHLRLVTTRKTDKITEGVLFLMNNNTVLCDTLEDRIRDVNGNGVFDGKEKKVYGETAIPGNTYKLKKGWWNKHQKHVVEICDVPDFTDIYLHWLADVKYSLGCVGVGNRDIIGHLQNTGMTDKMVKLLDDYGGTGEIEILR